MGYVRVKPWERTCVVLHPVTEQHEAPDAGKLYRDDDPLVVEHPWLFATDEEIAAATEAGAGGPVTEVRIEQATAAPGERRGQRGSRTRR